METNELESQSPETEQDATAALQAQIKELQSQLKSTSTERDSFRKQADKFGEELSTFTAANGDVAKLRSEFEQKHQALQHEYGLSAFNAALMSIPASDREVAEAITLKGGRYFSALDTGKVVLFDSDGTPAIGAKGQYVEPHTAAAQALAKLGASSTKAPGTGLKPYSLDSEGNLLVPRRAAAGTGPGASEYRKRMSLPENMELFSAGKIKVLDDSAFGAPSVVNQLARKQAENTLTITKAELASSRDWCRKNNVDPSKFSAMLNSDRIRVVT